MKKILWALLPLLLLTACGGEKVPEITLPVEVEIPYVEETLPELPYAGVELTFRSVWQEEEPQAQVTVQAAQIFEKKTGAVVEYSIVGADEADPYARKISTESPIGGGLLGATVGQTVAVDVPAGTIQLKVLEIFR